MMTRIGGRGCRVCFQMPYGVECISYPEVCGRILADTGSTTSLINTDSEKKKRPRGIDHGSRNGTKKNANNGSNIFVDHCTYVRRVQPNWVIILTSY